MPAPAILRFARVIRWAIVVSGTRKAAAISGTVSPPSSRSVSATRASGARAGWQHVKISRSRSSSTGPVASWGSGSWIISACRCLSSRRCSRRIRSMARLPAVVVSQPPGLGGMPSARHFSSATTSASPAASSAMSRSPKRRASDATTRPNSSRKIRSIAASASSGPSPACARAGSTGSLRLERPDLDRALAGGRPLAGPGERGVQVGRLDHPEAAEPLLGLGERAVGEDRLGPRCCRRWSRSRAASGRRRTPTRRRPAARC